MLVHRYFYEIRGFKDSHQKTPLNYLSFNKRIPSLAFRKSVSVLLDLFSRKQLRLNQVLEKQISKSLIIHTWSRCRKDILKCW